MTTPPPRTAKVTRVSGTCKELGEDSYLFSWTFSFSDGSREHGTTTSKYPYAGEVERRGVFYPVDVSCY